MGAETRHRVQMATSTMSKSAAPVGAVVIGVGPIRVVRRYLRAPSVWDELCCMRLVFAGHLPLLPRTAEGGPCAGYSGFEIEPGSARSIGMGEPTYPRAQARPPVG